MVCDQVFAIHLKFPRQFLTSQLQVCFLVFELKFKFSSVSVLSSHFQGFFSQQLSCCFQLTSCVVSPVFGSCLPHSKRMTIIIADQLKTLNNNQETFQRGGLQKSDDVYSKHRNGNKTFFFFSCLMIISNTRVRIMHRGSNETDMIKIFDKRKKKELLNNNNQLQERRN